MPGSPVLHCLPEFAQIHVLQLQACYELFPVLDSGKEK